jgi:hypothetical protein
MNTALSNQSKCLNHDLNETNFTSHGTKIARVENLQKMNKSWSKTAGLEFGRNFLNRLFYPSDLNFDEWQRLEQKPTRSRSDQFKDQYLTGGRL